MSIIKAACDAEGIIGSGVRKWVTDHCTIGTVASMLCKFGHADSSIGMRTGHRQPNRSLQPYQKLLSAEGKRQQETILSSNRQPSKIPRTSDFAGESERASNAPLHSSANDVAHNDVPSTATSAAPSKNTSQPAIGSIGNLNNSNINIKINVYRNPTTIDRSSGKKQD